MKRQTALVLVLTFLAAAAAAQPPQSVPQPIPGEHPPAPRLTPEVLARGQDRFDIFCAPCHGFAGDGDGMVVQRGFPAPPPYHLLDLSLEHIVDVITHGRGRMLPMAERIPVSDRWAIAAYVQALQLSREPPEDAPGDGP